MQFSQFLLDQDLPENLAALIYYKYLEYLFAKLSLYYSHGQHNCLVFLNKPLDFQECSINEAAKNGQTETVQFLIDHNAPIPSYALLNAVKKGYIEIVRLFLEHDVDVSNTFYAAACYDHEEILALLLKKYNTAIPSYALSLAVSQKRIPAIKLLLKYKATLSKYVLLEAAEDEDKEIFLLLLQYRTSISPEDIHYVRRTCSDEIAKLMLDEYNYNQYTS